MKALVWHDEELGAKFDVTDIPADLQDQADEYRQELIDVVSHYDDTILEKFLGDEEITADDLQAGLCARPPSTTASSRSSPARRSRTRACSPCSTRSSTSCRRPLDLPPVTGMSLKGNEELERKPIANEPFAALAFKIVADPHGKLTYFRVYSGTLDKGGTVLNAPHRPEGARRPPARSCTPTTARTSTTVQAGDIVAGIGLKNTRTGDTLCDEKDADRPRGARVPRARHPRRRRAEDQGRPGQDGQGPLLPLRGGPDLPGPHRRGDRPDRHLRHGRAAPRGARRPHAARVQRSTPPSASRRSPTARRSPSRSRRSCTATSSRPAARASSPTSSSPSSPPGPAAATSSTTRSPAGASRRSTSRRSTQGIQAAMTTGVLAGFPTVDVQGHPHRRLVPRRRLVGDGVQDRRHHGASRRPPARPSPSCSSRSWPSRSSPPRTTWATSWATCRPAGARSAAWSSGATARSSGPRCPCRRCSATLPTSVRGPRAEPPTPCSSTRTSRCPRAIQEEIVERIRGE